MSSDGSNKFGIGSDSDVTFDVSQSDPANNLWKVVVSYGGGQQGRQSKVEYDHSSTTGMTFEKENPELTYVSFQIMQTMSYSWRLQTKHCIVNLQGLY